MRRRPEPPGRHDGLRVCDGAIIPEAIGVNPSRTIAALAERNAKFIFA